MGPVQAQPAAGGAAQPAGAAPGGAAPLAGDEAGAAAGPTPQEGDHGQASGTSNRVPPDFRRKPKDPGSIVPVDPDPESESES